ncbi:MAG: adenylate/guanylate cyclase domain-containing protein [Ardenticatenaceae bacterium]|nr:adenylate/guanylate cyclase domain-containing protein [Ardenticatenaceae bacterium]
MKKSHKLLIYDAIGKRYGRQLLAGFTLVFILIVIELWFGWLDSWRMLMIVAAALLAIGWLYFMFWVRNSAVHFEKKGLRIQGPFASIVFPYEQILVVVPARVSDHFSPENYSGSSLDELHKFYNETAVYLGISQDAMPVAGTRRWFSTLLFSTQKNGLILLLDDWVAFARNLEKIRKKIGRPVKKQKPTSLFDLITPGQVLGQPGNPLILVADENKGRIKTYERLLVDRYQIIFASDGTEALQLAREFRPDMIVLDQYLDRLDGLQLTVSLRRTSQFSSIPILLMADKPTPKAFEAGVNDVIVRPLHEEDFLARLAQQINIQEKMKSLANTADRLENKTLNQMAELIKRGELINFLPEQVARNILSGQLSDPKSMLQRRKITVLFVDLVGFTELTGRLNPSMLSDLVNEFLREMTAVVLANHGTVDKFIGDEVMVLFGAPEDQDEAVQAAHAAQTAVEMLYAVQQMSLRWKPQIPVKLNVRIGFNTGYGTAGIFGNELLKSYTVVGSVVNIAARLRAAAAPGQIVCSGESYALIEDRFQAESLGGLELKGISQPINAYALATHIFQETV